jgi:WXXGXW repeat (2 copies)
MQLKTHARSLFAALLLLALPALSMAQVGVNISVNVPPPELPVYEQPPIPGDGYLWTPGYWAWGDDIQDYYWVPGTWVLAPQPNYLWTPGYWGWQGGAYLWNAGYWGPHVGFYGGVNYGYGYGGNGYEGGYWQGGHLYYNRSVTNVSNTHITNVYNKTVINNVTVNRVSYNGGTGGVRAQASSTELAAAHEQHLAAVSAQRQQETTARGNPSLRASQNQGHPPIAATARPGEFSGAGVVPAKRTGTMNVVRTNPSAHPTPPQEHIAQPQEHTAQPQNRPAQPTPRPAQPAREPAPGQQPGVEQHRQPEQTEQTRPAAPQPRPAPKPQSAPRPAEHPPEHQDEHEHH